MSSPTPAIPDAEIEKRVDELWKKEGLEETGSLTLEKARPFIEAYLKSTRNIVKVDDGLIMQIFNEIDEDGNQALDRREMYDFMKRVDFKEPNAPAPLPKLKTMSSSGGY